MPSVERHTDNNTGGGVVVGPCAPTVITNGLMTSLRGDCVSSHGPAEHAHPHTTVGSPTVIAEGLPVIHFENIDTCGHKRDGTSPDVFVEG